MIDLKNNFEPATTVTENEKSCPANSNTSSIVERLTVLEKRQEGKKKVLHKLKTDPKPVNTECVTINLIIMTLYFK